MKISLHAFRIRIFKGTGETLIQRNDGVKITLRIPVALLLSKAKP
jgi:hypothetical protein